MTGESKITIAVSVVAALISFATLGYAVQQAKTSQNQLLLSMKPSVNFETDDDSDDAPVGIDIDNAGPGPAVIQSVTYYMDRKPMGDDVKIQSMVPFPDSVNFFTLEKDDTLAVGERHTLVGIKAKPHSKLAQKDLESFDEMLDQHLAIEVSFCPVIAGTCYKKCSTTGWCG